MMMRGYHIGHMARHAADEKPRQPVAAILRRIAAIWKRPAIAAGQAGAALGAAVAAAIAIEPEAGRDRLAQRLRQTILTGQPVFQPDPLMVQAYHAPSGYLDQLESAFEKLRSVKRNEIR